MTQGRTNPVGDPFDIPRGASSTPLARVMNSVERWENINPTMIPKTLETAVCLCGPNLEFDTKDVSAHYLCAAVAIALL